MNRREFLAGAGAAAGVTLAGCADLWPGGKTTREPTGTSATGPNGTANRTVNGPTNATRGPTFPDAIAADWGLDVVNLAEKGADTSGSRPVDDLLDEHAGDGTLVYFPAGRYRLTTEVALDGVERAGFVGDGATIVPPRGFTDRLFGFGDSTPVGDLLFEGFTFDIGAPATGGRVLLAKAKRPVVRDVSVDGSADVDQDLLRVDVTDPGGTGRVDRYVAPHGAPSNTSVTGCEVGDDNRGSIAFVDCHVAGFPDNGLYARPPEGSVAVLGGRYLNNGVAGVRVQVSGQSVVRGVHVRCDDATGGDNMRGIRLRSGRDVLVDDCLVELLDVTSSDGGVTFASALESGTVRNTEIRVDADGVNAIRVKTPTGRTARDGPFRIEGVRVTGSASGGAAIRVSDRGACSFTDLGITQTGRNRDGLVAENVRGSLEDVSISVTGRPLALQGSQLTRRNVTVGSP